MTQVTYRDVTGNDRTLTIDHGDSVMHAAVSNGIPGIVGECGGALSCSTCHVYVDEACVSRHEPDSELEDDMLEGVASERRPTSRLSCQLHLDDDETLLVHTPAEQY
jgi:2Fe-2S ferredoxin